MVDTATGDRVRYEDDERLDIPDADAMQTLIYNYIGRALGGLFGPAEGAFSSMAFTASVDGGNPVIDIGEGLIFGAHLLSPTGAGQKTADGILISHDPALPDQTSRVNAAVFEPAQQEPYIWAALSLLETDTDTRRKWDIGTSDEITFSPKTRIRQRVKFELSLTEPGATFDSPWIRIGQITSWTGSGPALPTVTAIHPFDGAVDDTDDLKRRVTRVLGNYNVLGLNAAFTWILYELLAIKDTAAAGATNPNDSYALNDLPPRGLHQVDAALTTLEAIQPAIEAAGVQCILRGHVVWSPSIYNIGNLEGYPTSTGIASNRLGTGEVEITCPGRVYSMHVISLVPTGSPPAGTRTIYSVGAVNYDGGTNKSTFKIWLWDEGGATLTDQSFYLTAFGDPSP
jgi:hypothetical protein